MIKIQKIKKIKFSKNLVFVLLGSVLILFVIVIVIFQTLYGRVKQPIAFNHKIHMENDLECLDCHPYFRDHTSSGRPTLETCSDCHEEPLGESKAEKKLIEFIKSGKEVEWRRLYRVPEDVYFSHKRHVVSGNIECSTCHGNIGESSKPPSKPDEITMKKCIKCHEEKGADIDCISCHR